jgi:hypothetical protein
MRKLFERAGSWGVLRLFQKGNFKFTASFCKFCGGFFSKV